MFGIDTAALVALIVPALLPGVIDGIKMVISRLTGIDMAAPKSVAEVIQLKQADTERLKALADLDRPVGNISPWVADLRASFRYVCVGVILLAYVATLFLPDSWINSVTRADIAFLARECIFFIIGDRVYTNLKNK